MTEQGMMMKRWQIVAKFSRFQVVPQTGAREALVPQTGAREALVPPVREQTPQTREHS